MMAAFGCGKLLALEDSVHYAEPGGGNVVNGEAGTADVQSPGDSTSTDAIASVDGASDAQVAFSCNSATSAELCFDSFVASEWMDDAGVCTSSVVTDPVSGSALRLSAQSPSGVLACNLVRKSPPFDGSKGWSFRARVFAWSTTPNGSDPSI